jgi:hypothetical protein
MAYSQHVGLWVQAEKVLAVKTLHFVLHCRSNHNADVYCVRCHLASWCFQALTFAQGS